MSDIMEIRKIVSDFLKKNLEVKDAKVIKISKENDNWVTESEVYEESSFIKSLGLPTRMQDRNVYIVKLDKKLEIQSYERKEGSESPEKPAL
jgi:alcohol dehydrogenase YqhD (iron-dependent ADH family)